MTDMHDVAPEPTGTAEPASGTEGDVEIIAVEESVTSDDGAPDDSARGGAPDDQDARGGDDGEDRYEGPGRAEGEDAEPEASEAGDGDASDAEPSDRPDDLVEEGDVAADYLEGLLDIVDLDGDIDIDVENERAAVAVVEVNAGELEDLVGEDGEVLSALQDLTRLAVARETGHRSRLMLDIAGHRATRRTELQRVGRQAIKEAQETGAPVRLAAMSAFERKVVHDVVAEAGLVSESEGTEPQRYVVITPA